MVVVYRLRGTDIKLKKRVMEYVHAEGRARAFRAYGVNYPWKPFGHALEENEHRYRINKAGEIHIALEGEVDIAVFEG